MNLLIACKNIEDEIKQAMEKTDCQWPVQWIDAGLHNTPEKLRQTLQTYIDEAVADCIVLGFGFCGNALLGLSAPERAPLVFPRADDCITLCLGSQARREGLGSHNYYLIKGWMDSDQNMWAEYRDVVERYGQETADIIYEEMLRGYEKLVTINTHVCDESQLRARAEEMAAVFDLEVSMIEGDDSLTKRLLSGDWDDDSIITLQPGETVTLKHIFS